MACAGLKNVSFSSNSKPNNMHPTMKVLEMAAQITNYVKTLTWGQEGKKITLKIGIHYGKVIAGVIGEHKPQFSLIGDTVNTTSRVCSTSEIGIITLSEEAYLQIKDSSQSWAFTLREVEAKGKGVLNTYKAKKNYNKNKIFSGDKRPFSRESFENSENKFSKILEFGKLVSKEFLKQSSNEENDFVMQKILSIKERSSINFEGEYIIEENRSFLMNMEEKEKMENSQKSFNFSAEDENKRVRLLNNYKVNFMQTKKNLTNEFLEDLIEINDKIPSLNPEKSRKSLNSAPNLILNDENQRISLNQKIIIQPDGVKETKEQTFLNENDSDVKLITFKNQFFLLFNEKCNGSLIQEYEENLLNFGNNGNRIGLFSYFIVASAYIFQFVSNQYILDSASYIYWLLVICRISQIVLPVILMKFVRPILQKFKKVFLILLFVQSFTSLFLFVQFHPYILSFGYLLEELMHLTVFLMLNTIYFIDAFIYMSLLLLTFVLNILIYDPKNIIFWITFIFFSANCGFILFKIHKKHDKCIEQLNSLKINLHHKKQQEKLITYLLPPHIFSAFTQNKSPMVDNLEDVTILFADIAGFTKYSSSVSALEVLSMLRQLFTEFDKLCLGYKIYKLYTIGDCYVILGFLDIQYRDPILEMFRVLMAGFEMIDIIAKVKKQINFNDLNMRIGIHTVSLL